VDPLERIAALRLSFLARCRIPEDLESITSLGEESPGAGVGADSVERLWSAVEALYRTGVYPAVQVCIRREGHVVLNRAIGHASGNAPDDPVDAPKEPVTVDTPFCIFSAAKAITAMVIHKLDEQHVLHLEDPVCDFIPEFARHGKHRVTIRHILSHRAGMPQVPRDSITLDTLAEPERVVEALCHERPRTRPGRALAYHAVTGGFILGELVRRVTGKDVRAVLREQIAGPLGLRWLGYGVRSDEVSEVAHNAVTGPPPPPPISTALRAALGAEPAEVVEMSNDPRFLTAIVPSANVVTTAVELSAFYQCLLDGGSLGGVRVFEPSTITHATAEQSIWELDLTLGLPLRYGLGFMLGGQYASVLGWDNPLAFGHVGFTNIFSWADPERDLSVAIITSGKPVLSTHAVRLVQLMNEIHDAFPKLEGEVLHAGWRLNGHRRETAGA